LYVDEYSLTPRNFTGILIQTCLLSAKK